MDQPLRFRWLLRSIIILPWALPTIVNALMWRWIDNAEYGSLNALLTQTGIIHEYQPWLSNSDTAMWMIILADVWKLTPLCAILLLAGLQSVDREVVEVAQVDGAGPVSLFRHIILPLILPVVLVVLVLRTMEAFKVFDIIWIMTHGGPANSTQTIAIYAYQTAYQGFDFGRGAALGYLIALVIMVLAAIYLRLLGRAGR
jgi:multiple sugar transport system permease protein/N,N'-diacetylchitobiose transport system permease protein